MENGHGQVTGASHWWPMALKPINPMTNAMRSMQGASHWWQMRPAVLAKPLASCQLSVRARETVGCHGYVLRLGYVFWGEDGVAVVGGMAIKQCKHAAPLW